MLSSVVHKTTAGFKETEFTVKKGEKYEKYLKEYARNNTEMNYSPLNFNSPFP